jgi:hypothetical protein
MFTLFPATMCPMLMTSALVTVASSAGVPVQPVMPVNDDAVVPVYAQLPVTPPAVNVPLPAKPATRR